MKAGFGNWNSGFTIDVFRSRRGKPRFVPEGHPTIARRFNAGLQFGISSSPEGTAERFNAALSRPFRAWSRCYDTQGVAALCPGLAWFAPSGLRNGTCPPGMGGTHG